MLTIDRACISSILRLYECVELTRTDDYTYRKMRGAMWAFAELACGLLCSCFPILPRLYQHISAIAPYTHHSSAQEALRDPETKGSISKAARRGLSKSKGGKKE